MRDRSECLIIGEKTKNEETERKKEGNKATNGRRDMGEIRK
jgi:hypothetical protein